MARFSRKRGPSKRKKKSRLREQAKCRFCREKVKEVDYKNLAALTKLTTQQGKLSKLLEIISRMLPRKDITVRT